MYNEFYGLRETPFSLTPDTLFYYNQIGHQQALNVLLVSLNTGEGFIKITGEVGTGKTLLCRKLLDSLPDQYISAYLPNPILGPLDLYKAIADELSIPLVQTTTLHEILKQITTHLIQLQEEGKQVVICFDEVQVMPENSLEAVRLLSNLDTEKRKLLQIVFFAQPELDTRLATPSLRQLNQRITFSYQLEPLQSDEVIGYIHHRLHVAGFQGEGLFDAAALRKIGKVSRGIPRLINRLSHKALMAAYGEGKRIIGARHIAAAVRDSDDLKGSPIHFSGWVVGGIALFLVLETAALFYLLRNPLP